MWLSNFTPRTISAAKKFFSDVDIKHPTMLKMLNFKISAENVLELFCNLVLLIRALMRSPQGDIKE